MHASVSDMQLARCIYVLENSRLFPYCPESRTSGRKTTCFSWFHALHKLQKQLIGQAFHCNENRDRNGNIRALSSHESRARYFFNDVRKHRMADNNMKGWRASTGSEERKEKTYT